MNDLVNTHPSVLRNKISKANKMIAEYALAQPGEFGRTAESIALSLTYWTSWRDELVAAYNAR